MSVEDTIKLVLDEYKGKGLIAYPSLVKDFIDYRTEDSSQGIPPHMCYRFTTPEIDALNNTFPTDSRKSLGKFRFRYFALFEIYTYDTHEIEAHEGITLDLTFPVPEVPDSISTIRDSAFNKINAVFTDRAWARPYSGANWHHFHINEVHKDDLAKDPEGFDKALEKFLREALDEAISLSKKINL